MLCVRKADWPADADYGFSGGLAEGYTDAESTWDEDTLIVELRYFPALANAISAAGFMFEREAFPN